MFKRFLSPRKGSLIDMENGNGVIEMKKQTGNSPMTNLTWTRSNMEQRQFDMLGDCLLEVTRVTVDSARGAPTTFNIPKRWLTRTSEYFQRYYSAHNTDISDTPATKEANLPKVFASHFYEFDQWLRTGRIITILHMYAQYAIEHNARRLVDALALGMFLESREYLIAVMKEFLALGKLLEWPEDYVNTIFDSTAGLPKDVVHPARTMIVAIVAAKTVGKGKRKVRQGPRDKGVERGDRISGNEFWTLYDEHVRLQVKGGECRYPDKVDEVLTESAVGVGS